MLRRKFGVSFLSKVPELFACDFILIYNNCPVFVFLEAIEGNIPYLINTIKTP